MRKRALYYCIFFEPPDFKDVAYVMAQYSDGDMRYWYPEDRGFKSAKYKALHNLTK